MINKELMACRLIQCRGEKSQQEAADAINITVASLKDYEAANRVPNDGLKLKLAAYYQVSVEWLFFGKDENVAKCGKK